MRLIVFLLIPSFVFAASGGDAGHHEPALADTFIFWVNFIISVAILYFILRKPLSKGLDARKRNLESSILQSERELEQAKAKLTETENLLKGLDSEVEEIKEKAKKEILNENNKILNDAKNQSVKIIENAKVSAQNELNSMNKKLQAEFGEKVYELALEKLKNSFSPEQDKEYRKAAYKGLKAMRQ